MTKNNKPILSILIDEDKRVKFADLAKRNNLSMSYLVNQAIDRMLETDSIDIHRDSIVASVGNYVDSSVGGMSRTDIEELIKSSIVSTDIERLVNSYVDSHNSSLVSVDDVKQLITASANELLELIPSDIPTLETIKAEINLSIAPHADRLAELEIYAQSQLAAVRDEIKKAISNRSVTTEAVANVPTSPRKEKPSADGDTRTWCGFFEMIEMTALTGAEAQKKENADIRAQQIERGLQSAIDKGFGEWAVKKVGREFVRVDTTTESPLPLFPN